MDDLMKLRAEKAKCEQFAMEANDILRNVWNEALLDEYPVLKERLRKLLDAKYGEGI